uniref:ribosomal protein S18 n=1 Tax=Hormidiella parvula TaxID=2058785 RepID=UPI00286C055A|nr:ribosomal protein S18 [Hormidiella parvula]WKT06023.1 ribosomal protein S18 [Hormidiella parvula]
MARQRPSVRASRRRFPPIKPGESIDCKNVDLLKRFVTEQNKIFPRRVNRLTAKQQRCMTTSIKRARVLALVGFLRHNS